MVNSYFAQKADLLEWRKYDVVPTVQPWKPEPLNHTQWPPDYKAVYAWRMRQLALLRSDPALMASAKAYYRTRQTEFIMHWMDTYDPRLSGNKWIPFVFFIRQAEFIQFLNECARDDENGLVEKVRDAGATWLACAYSVHCWLFNKNDSIGWGSRKQELVDKLGDPSSIFEKLRMLVKRLPIEFRPIGLRDRDHLVFMKMINPENGSIITGETGDNIGRGARTRIYFVDEAAHVERAEKVEAALGDTTRVRIDISSVNGIGNVFHKKRENGIDWRPNASNLMPGYTRVFVIDWRDHPEKTQAWFDTRRAKYEREGMIHIFAQEVERNYSAAISNTVIPYAWLEKCIDAHKHIRWRDDYGRERVGFTDAEIPNAWSGAMDVADEGIDTNALAIRQWIIFRDIEEWGERDPGVSARRAMAKCRQIPNAVIQYDSIGIGSNVKSEYNRLVDEKIIDPAKLRFVGWNAGAAVVEPFNRIIPDDDDSAMNKDFFENMKAQAWWSLRSRVYRTYMNITQGAYYPVDQMISFDSRMVLLHKLLKELAQVTHVAGASLKMVVDKKPLDAKGNKTKSPNLADAGVMMFFPVDDGAGRLQIGNYG